MWFRLRSTTVTPLNHRFPIMGKNWCVVTKKINMTILLSVDNISIAYQQQTVVKNLSFQLEQGDIACLLGASGCGKTSVLRAIAGFEPVSVGQISLQQQILSQPKQLIPAHQRRCGMVFQDYALFPHLTVSQNIALGLHKQSAAQRQQRVDELIDLVKLSAFAKQYPHQLSGGQQQRVALARALAPKPLLLLLDEPFSNLDAELRESLSLEVRALLKAENTTAILVTHDQHEAFAMADYVGVMYNGQIEQWASPYELYHQPSSRHIAQFIGEGVLVAGKRCSDDGRIALELGEIGVDVCACEAGEEVEVLIRPDDIIHDDNSPMQAKVLAKAFRGAEFLYTLELSSGTKVLSLVPSHHNHQLGEMIGIKLSLDHTVAFAKTRI